MSSHDLSEQIPQAIVDPDSGEMIDAADVSKVVDLYGRMKQYSRQWRDAEKWCRDRILDAADERHVWSWHEGRFKVTCDPPSASDIDWDMDELHKLEAMLPSDVYGELVEQVVTEKPKTVRLQTLARQAGPDSDVAKIIAQAERRKPRARYVKVAL